MTIYIDVPTWEVDSLVASSRDMPPRLPYLLFVRMTITSSTYHQNHSLQFQKLILYSIHDQDKVNKTCLTAHVDDIRRILSTRDLVSCRRVCASHRKATRGKRRLLSQAGRNFRPMLLPPLKAHYTLNIFSCWPANIHTMAEQGGELQLFSQCKVCIICSKDLSADTAHQVW